jgi:hypothetical protein
VDSLEVVGEALAAGLSKAAVELLAVGDAVEAEGAEVFAELAPSNPTQPKSPCTQPILNAVNNQFGTPFNQNDVQGVPFDNGGGTNLNILGTNLPASQFNSLQTGRYPINWYTYLIGYGPTLHITGTTHSDPPPAFFGNSNIGGQTSILFTAHTDSSFAYNPIGFLIHVIIDIFHVGGPRKPCPV